MHVHRLSMVMAMNVRQRHKKLRVRRKAALPRYPLPPLLAAGMTAGYLIGCCCGANAALPDSSGPGAFVFAKRWCGRYALRRAAAGTVYLVRVWLCVFAAVDVVSRLFADPRRFRCQRFSVRLYGGCFFALRLRTRVCPVVHCGRFARCVCRAGAVFARVLCAQMSVRLMEQRRGLPSPAATERCSRELALVFCLLLAAAATASYAVPFFTKLILVTDGHSG